jgi:outer membrane lipoprotein SlyB
MKKSLIALLVLSASLCFGDTIVLRDGTRHDGTLQSATSRSVTFKEGHKINRYLRSNIQSIEFGTSTSATYSNPYNSSNNPSLSSRENYDRRVNGIGNTANIPSGTEIAVMTNENIDSATANEGQTFSADVAENVTDANGRVVIPKGSEAGLILRKVASQGTVTGSSDLVLDLESVKVNGRRYTVSTEDVEQKNNEGIGKNKRTATMVGGGAVFGTLIGAVAGGGKGAAIGAVTGAAAGAGAQVLTRGKSVKVPAESTLRFKLDEPLRLNAAY